MGDEAVAATDTACSWLQLCYRMKQEHRAAITRKPQVKQDLFFFSSRVEKTCLVHSCQDLVQCSEKALAPHSSTLAWKIPWTEEPGRLQSMGSRRVGTRLSDFTFIFHFHALEKEMATHSSVLAWRIPGTGEPVGCRLWGHTDMTEAT